MTLASCSSAPPKPKEPEKPSPPVTGRQAFQQTFPSARTWAADAQPALLQSINLTEVPTKDGKAGAWQAIFISPSRGQARMYTWSAADAPGNLHKGVFAGSQEPIGDHKPFLVVALKTDSDQAYQIAVQHASEYLKKNPGKPVVMLLEMNSRFPDLTWRIIWGQSVGASEYSVFVDATTGKFLERLSG
jgi:hypothetical protein